MQRNLFIGSNGHVCAVDPGSGIEIWRTKLQEGFLNATHSGDVSVLVRDGVVFAGCEGHLFALSCDSGEILWHNTLKGLRFNDISLAVEGQSIQFIQKVVRQSSDSSSNS